jgi:hypothetical protein
MPKQGWAKRQVEKTARSISEWPEWMRREAEIKKAEEAQKAEKDSKDKSK